MQEYNEQAEKAILAEIMLDEMAMCEIIGDLKPNDFYIDDYSKIYAKAVDFFEDGESVDYIHLADALKGKIGIATITDIMQSRAPSKAMVESRVRLVRGLSQRRQIRSAATKALGMLKDGEETEEVIAALEDALTPMESSKIEIVGDVMPHIVSDILSKRDEYSQVKTQIPGLDGILGYLGQTDLVLIAARPAVGKTALALQIALSNALTGKGVYMESLEMTHKQLYTRMISNAGEIDATMIKHGTIGDRERDKIKTWGQKIGATTLFVHEGARTVGEIRANIKKLKARCDIKLAVIDYLQLMTAKGENRNVEVGAISRGLKAAALDLKIPIIALSQLNRDKEKTADKLPMLSQLRDSGSLEQDADTVILLHDKVEDYGEVMIDLIVAKHRSGPQGTVTVEFKPQYQKFVKVGA